MDIKSNEILFTSWDKDDTLHIQLEPEAIIFKLMPGNEILFEGFGHDFYWALRYCKDGFIQLFPEGKQVYEINVYENSVLLEDWYKYM